MLRVAFSIVVQRKHPYLIHLYELLPIQTRNEIPRRRRSRLTRSWLCTALLLHLRHTILQWASLSCYRTSSSLHRHPLLLLSRLDLSKRLLLLRVHLRLVVLLEGLGLWRLLLLLAILLLLLLLLVVDLDAWVRMIRVLLVLEGR